MVTPSPATPAARFTVGDVGPAVDGGEPVQQILPHPLLPPDVRHVIRGIHIEDYTPEGVEEAIGRYWQCIDALVAEGAGLTSLGGIPISSQLGRERVLALLAETQQRTGVPATSAAEDVVAAFHRLGTHRVAVASRWAPQLNERVAAYLHHGGLQVAAITSEGQWARQAFAMTVERGLTLAIRLGREAMALAPDADALFLPGGTWRSLAAVPPLEEEFGVPVVINQTALVWRVMTLGEAPPVAGWGRLLEQP